MLCDNCHKNEATVHLTEIINDKVTKMHLCEECAKAKGSEMESHFGLSDLLAGLADIAVPQESKGQAKALKCPSCGFTFQEFQKIGRLGCPVCYETFGGQLNPLLKRIHGSDRHFGKVPAHFNRGKTDKETNEIQDLKLKLQKAVSDEAFEEAAVLRDKIKDIENNLKKKGKNED